MGGIRVEGPPASSNGSKQPELALAQIDGSDPTLVYVRIRAKDLDGYVREIKIDWGDDSSPTAIAFRLAECKEPKAGWPESRHTQVISHRYDGPGEYTATGTMASVGCDGKAEQHASADTVVQLHSRMAT